MSESRPTEKFWDEQYDSGEYLTRWNRCAPTHDLPAMICSGFIQRDSTVLDLGCGAGTDAIYLASKGLSTIGADISSAAIRIAAKRAFEAGVDVEWHHADVCELPIADSTIDFVTDAGCFHHLHESDRVAYVMEIDRVLKNGGRLLLRWAEIPGVAERIDGPMLNRYFTHETFTRGPRILYDAASDTKSITANMVLIEKREASRFRCDALVA